MDKAAIRAAIWDRLDEEGIARFPFPPHGRIPNFDGATKAAGRLAERAWWHQAEVIKCNPDAPQRPLREQALAAGITVVMAEPRLRSSQPFIALDPGEIDDFADAATIAGATEHGTPLEPADIPPIDGIVAGSVAVDETGRRIGKGEGYSDLEFAVLLELGVIERSVPVATTVHDVQVRDGPLPTSTHDVPLDVIATPTVSIETTNRPARPSGIDWLLIDDKQRQAIPVLDRL